MAAGPNLYMTALALIVGFLRDPTLPYLLAREEVATALTSWDCYRRINSAVINCCCTRCQFRCLEIANDHFILIGWLGDTAARLYQDRALGLFIDEIDRDSPALSDG